MVKESDVRGMASNILHTLNLLSIRQDPQVPGAIARILPRNHPRGRTRLDIGTVRLRRRLQPPIPFRLDFPLPFRHLRTRNILAADMTRDMMLRETTKLNSVPVMLGLLRAFEVRPLATPPISSLPAAFGSQRVHTCLNQRSDAADP